MEKRFHRNGRFQRRIKPVPPNGHKNINCVEGMEEDLACERVRNQTYLSGFIDPSLRPEGAAFQSVQFVIQVILLFFFLLSFALLKFVHPKRKRLYRLRVRKLRHVFIICLGALFCMLTGSYYSSRPLTEGTPCYLQIFGTMNIVPFLLLPALIRLYNFHCGDQLTSFLVTPSNNNAMGTGVDAQPNNNQQRKPTVHEQTLGEDEASEASPRSLLARLCRIRDDGRRMEDRLALLRFQTSERVLLMLLVLVMMPYIAVSIAFIAIQENVTCYGCDLDETRLFVVLVEAVLAILSVAFFVFLVRGKQDSFGVLREINQALLYGAVPTVICLILMIVVGQVGQFHFIMLGEMFIMVYCYFQSLHQCILAWQEYKVNAAAFKLYSISPQEFETLVLAPDGPYHAAFSKHLENEHSLESLSFLAAIDTFERGFSDVSAKTNASRAKRIVSLYVGDSAPLQCNLSWEVVHELKERVKLGAEFATFTAAKEEMIYMMYLDPLVRFLATKEFRTIYENQQQQAMVVAAPQVSN